MIDQTISHCQRNSYRAGQQIECPSDEELAWRLGGSNKRCYHAAIGDRAMQLSEGQWRRLLATCLLIALLDVVLGAYSPANAQQNSGSDNPDVSIAPRPVIDTLEEVIRRNGLKPGERGQRIAEKDVTCLLPPLTQMSSPTIAVEQLRTTNARNEYQQACAALRKKKNADAEQHLRKAVRNYPKYAIAWVTLGQVFELQQRIEEARKACSQGSAVDPGYVPAYLCLADIAVREHAWDSVLKLSGHAIELDPSTNAVAYEYHAAANMNLHNLAAAEKSGLRAVAIDKDHHEPRVHFVMAQIYETKGDEANEAAQLREYLKYSGSEDDVAMVEQYLSKLEGRSVSSGKADLLSRSKSEVAAGSLVDVGPPDIDASVPPVINGSCPLAQILTQASNRTLDLIEDLQRFSANERIEQSEIDKNGKRRNSGTEEMNYLVQIERNSQGYPSVQEYRSGNTNPRQASVMDSGTAAFALIFHPAHLQNFDFRCEGLTELDGSAAWQVHFEESADPNKAFTAIHIGGALYLPKFKGRAWIGTSGYDILRIETDLVAPIPSIDLQREHQVINYAPVEFQKRQVRLWLPESTSLYIAYRGHRYERVHRFSEFQVFSVDSSEAAKEPSPEKFRDSVADIFPPVSRVH
jgi:tetratricopeptide (TPR) repeat protein